MIAQNTADGPLKGKLDKTREAAVGYSWGGGAAIDVSDRPNIKVTASLHGMPPRVSDAFDKMHAPLLCDGASRTRQSVTCTKRARSGAKQLTCTFQLAELRHRDAAQRERHGVVAQCHEAQSGERIAAAERELRSVEQRITSHRLRAIMRAMQTRSMRELEITPDMLLPASRALR